MYGHLRPCSFMTGHAPGSPLLCTRAPELQSDPNTARARMSDFLQHHTGDSQGPSDLVYGVWRALVT